MTAAANPTEKSPSIIGVFFIAIIMAFLSGLLGVAYMATFSAEPFSNQADYEASLPDPEEGEIIYSKPGDAYYFEGPVLRSRSWESKRALLEAEGPQIIRFTPGEINEWMNARFRPAAAPSGEESSGVLVTPGVPNVAIVEGDVLYLSLPTEVSAYTEDGEFTVFARCSIDAAGLFYEQVNISGAKLPLPNVIGRQALATIAQAYESTDDYQIVAAAFERAESVKVENGELVISLR